MANSNNTDLERRVCGEVGIQRDWRLGILSLGQKRLIETFLAVEARPQLIIADEPLAGIFRTAAPDVIRRLRRFVDNFGALLVVLHERDMEGWSPDWMQEVKAAKGCSE